MITSIIKNTLYLILALFLIDLFWASLWQLSEQIPQDNFYLGSFTTHLINK